MTKLVYGYNHTLFKQIEDVVFIEYVEGSEFLKCDFRGYARFLG